MDLVFATQNKNKIKEVKLLLPPEISILSLEDLNCFDDIPETADTLEGNAKLKADYITEKYALPCFADDTGLLIDCLDGAPGVYSARYAGPEANAEANIKKVLKEMTGCKQRSARFITSIALNLNGSTLYFNGKVEGRISIEKMGENGFGYDPIFIPAGFEQSFAQMPIDKKNSISHRGKALELLCDYLIKTL